MLGGAIVFISRVFRGDYKKIYFVHGPRVDAIRFKSSEQSDKKNANMHILINLKGQHGWRVEEISR